MSTQNHLLFIIQGGPSKGDLLLSWGLKSDNGDRKKFDFRITPTKYELPGDQIAKITINSLEWEDGSGESWNIKGYAEAYNPTADIPLKTLGAHCDGHYNTRTRCGMMFIHF